ncbi:hypothetical protein OE88DRAFT_1803589 [Heliocybe sulcata]|uniref:WW domain-containing protein n=1 Tax=Heliocybe sulcata TaxID=5364 RepID=A0A5C3NI30_9AGAM|nr:hypothetical protein OE88DRAFT_1803589 [Heliocybe sulcata]
MVNNNNNNNMPPPPDGWVQEWDPNSQHPFWVDTKANPPRSIWTHPYDDEHYLSEHPDLRDKLQAQLRGRTDSKSNLAPPSYDEANRRHSYHGQASGSAGPSRASGGRNTSTPPPGDREKQKDRGFFGKLKDKAVGTKEEREEHKRQMRLLEERREKQRQELMKQRMEYMRQQYGQGNNGQSAYGSRYGPPAGNPYVMSGGYGYPGYGSGLGGGMMGGRGGFGGGGMALPLLGGMAGGLLLGDMMDGGFGGGYGGGFDGGYDQGGFF